MRKTLSASILVLALCSTVFAGDIPSPPAPCAGNISNPPLSAGDILSPPNAIPSPVDQTAGGLAGAALTVLDSVLALF
ncbi:MAG: hypothetical protein JOZ02_05000 [Acidobacteria bacterium]|nr:hypothetical protein [Acidobacteriota bacterium]